MLDAIALVLATIAAGPRWELPPELTWGRTLAPSYLAEPEVQACRAWSLAHPAPPVVSYKIDRLWPGGADHDSSGDNVLRCVWSVWGVTGTDGPDCARAAAATSSPAARRWYAGAATACDKRRGSESTWGGALAPAYLAEPEVQACRAWSLAHPAPPVVSYQIDRLWPPTARADRGDRTPLHCVWSVWGVTGTEGPDCARAAAATSSPAARRWYAGAAMACDGPLGLGGRRPR